MPAVSATVDHDEFTAPQVSIHVGGGAGVPPLVSATGAAPDFPPLPPLPEPPEPPEPPVSVCPLLEPGDPGAWALRSTRPLLGITETLGQSGVPGLAHAAAVPARTTPWAEAASKTPARTNVTLLTRITSPGLSGGTGPVGDQVGLCDLPALRGTCEGDPHGGVGRADSELVAGLGVHQP